MLIMRTEEGAEEVTTEEVTVGEEVTGGGGDRGRR